MIIICRLTIGILYKAKGILYFPLFGPPYKYVHIPTDSVVLYLGASKDKRHRLQEYYDFSHLFLYKEKIIDFGSINANNGYLSDLEELT